MGSVRYRSTGSVGMHGGEGRLCEHSVCLYAAERLLARAESRMLVRVAPNL